VRDLSEAEANRVREDRCPFCGSKLRPGPRGGLSQNFFCLKETCEAGFNRTPVPFACQLIRDPLE
jgi:hypothetical protein